MFFKPALNVTLIKSDPWRFVELQLVHVGKRDEDDLWVSLMKEFLPISCELYVQINVDIGVEAIKPQTVFTSGARKINCQDQGFLKNLAQIIPGFDEHRLGSFALFVYYDDQEFDSYVHEIFDGNGQFFSLEEDVLKKCYCVMYSTGYDPSLWIETYQLSKEKTIEILEKFAKKRDLKVSFRERHNLVSSIFG